MHATPPELYTAISNTDIKSVRQILHRNETLASQTYPTYGHPLSWAILLRPGQDIVNQIKIIELLLAENSEDCLNRRYRYPQTTSAKTLLEMSGQTRQTAVFEWLLNRHEQLLLHSETINSLMDGFEAFHPNTVFLILQKITAGKLAQKQLELFYDRLARPLFPTLVPGDNAKTWSDEIIKDENLSTNEFTHTRIHMAAMLLCYSPIKALSKTKSVQQLLNVILTDKRMANSDLNFSVVADAGASAELEATHYTDSQTPVCDLLLPNFDWDKLTLVDTSLINEKPSETECNLPQIFVEIDGERSEQDSPKISGEMDASMLDDHYLRLILLTLTIFQNETVLSLKNDADLGQHLFEHSQNQAKIFNALGLTYIPTLGKTPEACMSNFYLIRDNLCPEIKRRFKIDYDHETARKKHFTWRLKYYDVIEQLSAQCRSLTSVSVVLDCFDWLFTHNVNLNTPGLRNKLFLHYALRSLSLQTPTLISNLLHAGADANQPAPLSCELPDKRSKMISPLERLALESLDSFESENIPAYLAVTKEYQTNLSTAQQCIQLLIEYDAQVTKYEMRAAIRHNREMMVEMFLQSGFNPNVSTKPGKTLLDSLPDETDPQSSPAHSMRITALLLAYGLDLTHLSSDTLRTLQNKPIWAQQLMAAMQATTAQTITGSVTTPFARSLRDLNQDYPRFGGLSCLFDMNTLPDKLKGLRETVIPPSEPTNSLALDDSDTSVLEIQPSLLQRQFMIILLVLDIRAYTADNRTFKRLSRKKLGRFLLAESYHRAAKYRQAGIMVKNLLGNSRSLCFSRFHAINSKLRPAIKRAYFQCVRQSEDNQPNFENFKRRLADFMRRSQALKMQRKARVRQANAVQRHKRAQIAAQLYTEQQQIKYHACELFLEKLQCGIRDGCNAYQRERGKSKLYKQSLLTLCAKTCVEPQDAEILVEALSLQLSIVLRDNDIGRKQNSLSVLLMTKIISALGLNMTLQSYQGVWSPQQALRFGKGITRAGRYEFLRIYQIAMVNMKEYPRAYLDRQSVQQAESTDDYDDWGDIRLSASALAEADGDGE